MTSIFDTGLTLYRKTIKRVRPLHRFSHWVMTHTVIPVLEQRQGFCTMPDDPFWFRLELLTGRHETETMQHIKQQLKPGMVVLDIGAHVGYYARICAKKVGESGRVIAFEPHPRTFSMLQQNVASYANVTPIQAAVAEQTGTAELYDYLMMSASGSLHYDQTMEELQKSHTAASDHAPRLSQDFAAQTFTVQTVPIDSVLAEHGIERVDLIKMDIEGAEIGALRGMRQTIARSPGLALVMEYNPQALRAFGFVPEDALAEVLAMGFDRVQVIESDGALTDITGKTQVITDLTAGLMEHMDVVNLLVTRE